MEEKDKQPDEILVEKILQGRAEVDAFESIFHRYYPMVLNFIKGMLKDDGAATIDVIRARVGMPAMKTVPVTADPLMEKYYPNAKGTQKAAILEVRRERTVELCFEGFRQWDFLRWKMDICVYQGAKPTTTAPASNVIENGALSQNPGWTDAL